MIFVGPQTARVDGEAFAERVFGSGAVFRPVVRSGDPVEVFGAVLQAFWTGREVVLLDGSFREEEWRALWPEGDGGGRPLAGAPRPPRLAAVRARFRESPPAGSVRLFTSGTTGKPASVVHGWDSLARGVRSGPEHTGKVWGLAYNPTHVAGVQVFLQAFLNDCDLVNLFGRDAGAVLRALEREGVTHLSATPSFYRLLLAEPAPARPLAGVERITFGGERFDPDLAAPLRRLFPRAEIRNVYASTEAGTLLTSASEVFEVPPRKAGLFRVAEGRLWLSATLLGAFPGGGGWFDTGDRVEVLAEDPLRFRFTGREADNANVGGYNVSVAEVEDRLRRHPRVREARVTAKPNALLGRILVADVVPADPGLTERILRVDLEKYFQPHKVPRRIRLVEELGLSRTGKLRR
ncbi:MAG: class I adenylate-forming enzyme family protein [Puniceicoccaceae bacterium]